MTIQELDVDAVATNTEQSQMRRYGGASIISFWGNKKNILVNIAVRNLQQSILKRGGYINLNSFTAYVVNYIADQEFPNFTYEFLHKIDPVFEHS